MIAAAPARTPLPCAVRGPSIALAAAIGLASAPASFAAGTPTTAPLCGSEPLDILLTNDDGYEAPGIRALYGKLRAAGHRVVLVAPATNASGSAMSFTWTPVRITRDPLDPNILGVTGTPATAVILGTSSLYPPGRRPDLVISGINAGENVGSALTLSGTIGAALAGTTLLDPPIPGIAVNSARPAPGEAPPALPPDHLDQLAGDLTQLLERTRGWFCERGRVARSTTVLNVNYPARPLDQVRGTRVARQGRTPDLQITFAASGESEYVSKASTGPQRADAEGSDVALLREGYVTVTPIEAALDGRARPDRDLRRRLAK